MHLFGVICRAYKTGAGGGAFVDVVVQAGMVSFFELALAFSKRIQVVGDFQVFVYCFYIGEWSEIIRVVLEYSAGAKNTGIFVVGDADYRIGFSVFEIDIVARFVFLDEVVFEYKRFVLVFGYQDVNEVNFGNQNCRFYIFSSGKIRPDPVAKVFCLSHIDNFSFFVFHYVYAGGAGKFGNTGL